MTMKKILVACGTGVATSTVVAKKLEEKLKARGLAVQIDQCKASEVGTRAPGYDAVVATCEVPDAGGKPFVRTLSFLTGVGVDADVDRIAKLQG
jgi:PTS system galactitol-specific IIB component